MRILLFLCLSMPFLAFSNDNVQVIINGQNYTCSAGGSSSLGSPDCTVIKINSTDKYGTECKYSLYCVAYYEFGTVIQSEGVTGSSGFSEPGYAAEWCKKKLAGN